MKKKPSRALTVEEQTPAFKKAEAYWVKLRAEVTSSALFIDATGILDSHDPKFDRVATFLAKEAVNYRYITTTFVICETVRRLVNANPSDRFVGPQGQRAAELALDQANSPHFGEEAY